MCCTVYSPAATSCPGEVVAIHTDLCWLCVWRSDVSLLSPCTCVRIADQQTTGVYHVTSRPAYFLHHQLFVCLTTIDTKSTYVYFCYNYLSVFCWKKVTLLCHLQYRKIRTRNRCFFWLYIFNHLMLLLFTITEWYIIEVKSKRWF